MPTELVVKVIEAKELPAGDSNGKSDPYVKIKCGSKEKKTSTIKGTLNPNWNSAFVFKGAKPSDTVFFEVWDKDTFTSNDLLGKVSAYIDKFPDNEPQNLDLTLSNGGTLHVCMTWYPEGEKKGKVAYEQYLEAQKYQQQSSNAYYGGVQQQQFVQPMYQPPMVQQQMYGQQQVYQQPMVQQPMVQQQFVQQPMVQQVHNTTTTTISSSSNSEKESNYDPANAESYYTESSNEVVFDAHYGDLESTKHAKFKGDADSVTFCNFSENEIEKLENLDQFPNMRKLSLHTNSLVKIKGIEKCKNLEWVDLHNNDIENLKGLNKLPNLIFVDAHANYLADVDSVEAIAEDCPNIRCIDLGTNNYSKRQMKKINKFFKQKAPQCTVLWTQDGESDDDLSSDSDSD